MLYDDVLLAIFDFCVGQHPPVLNTRREIEAWQPLVHVCKRWRSVIFGSPLRLNLRLLCTQRTLRDALHVWPALPLVISDRYCLTNGLDNIVALLEHSDRVCQISFINLPSLHFLKTVLKAMRKPFPQLTDLLLDLLWLHHERDDDEPTTPAVPESFLGGSIPRLRKLKLYGIPFPGLPKLLLSATRLVVLHLQDIPPSGYISPEVMLATLSTLTSLESLLLGFQSPGRASRHPPPARTATRSVLPVLTELLFKGVSEYLDDLVAHIDAPQLSVLEIIFFNRIAFDTIQLAQFISCIPRLKVLKNARVVFIHRTAKFALSSQNSGHPELIVKTLWSDRQLSSPKHVWTSLPPLSTSEDLYIYENPFSSVEWQDNIEIMAWLELLRAFTAVKNLYISEQFAPSIAPALQELISGRTTEVLPALENIFLEGFEPSGYVQEGIEQFIAARQVVGHPIAVTCWERHEEDDDNDYVEDDDEEDDDDDDDDFDDSDEDEDEDEDEGGEDGD